MKIELFNKKSNNYSIVIEGQIGKDVDGYEIARELRYLKTQNPDKITIAINSIGGDPIQSYSIVNEMYSSDTIIETINIGVAYSSAGWILASGTKGHRKAKNFTSSMIHNAFSPHKKLQDVQTNSIKTILSDVTGNGLDIIESKMSVETFFEGEEQISFGIVDEIIPTSNQPIQNKNKYELMNLYKGFNTDKPNKLTMKEVTNVLGMSDQSTGKEIADKIVTTENAYKKEVSDLKADNLLKDEKIVELENKLKTTEDSAILSTFNKAVDDGKYEASQKDEIIAVANKIGSEAFITMVSSIKTPHVDVSNMINNSGGSSGQDKKYEDYSVEERREMKLKKPELFNKLLTDFQER